MIKNCLICGKEFKARNHRVKIGLGKFCSKQCFYASHIGFKQTREWSERQSKTMTKLWKTKNYRKKILPNMRRGPKSPHWKGGQYIKSDTLKYVMVKSPYHPYVQANGYVREHRLIMEKHLKRFLEPQEVVHHINGDTLDNRIENLELFKTNSSHMKSHLTSSSEAKITS